VYIEGRLQTRRWDDKEGTKHTSVEVVANEMMMLGDRREHNNHPQQPSEAAAEENNMTANEDEFPF
jgi:single-strand DNA-binding protein